MSIAEVEAQRGNVSGIDEQAMFPSGWTKIDNGLRRTRLGAYPKLLFVILRTYADVRGKCWPSFQTLAEDMEVSRSTVVRSMKKLAAEGLVRKVRRVSVKGSLTSNEYWVADSLRGYGLSDPTLVSERTSNKNQLTKSIQDSNSCPYVRNAREAETTEKISEPRIGEEASASSRAETPLRGGREEKPRGEFWWTHAWEVWPLVEGLVSVPAGPSEAVFVPFHDWVEVEALFEGHRSEGCFPATPEEFMAGSSGTVLESPLGESREADRGSVRPVDVSGPEGRGRTSTLRSDASVCSQENRKEPGSGGAWGDRVPLPSPKHVYGVRSDASEDHATGSVGGVRAAPVPSPTPDVPKPPRKPQWIYLQGAPKRWADDGKPTTIPPTFTPSPRHVAFGEAWGLDVELIGKAFVAKHLREGTLAKCWDLHFAELLEMKRCDKLDAEREAEALKPELEAEEAARQAKRREWSERLEAQKEGAVPPTKEFLDLAQKMEEIRRKYGAKPKPKGEPYGGRANSDVGGESHGGPRAAVCQQWDPGVFVHPGFDAAPSESGDPDVGGRGDDVRPLRRVEADGGERRGVPGEGPQGGGDRETVGADVRASGGGEDVDQPDGGRDRPVPQVCDREAGEDEPIDVAAEFYAWRKLRDAQLAAS